MWNDSRFNLWHRLCSPKLRSRGRAFHSVTNLHLMQIRCQFSEFDLLTFLSEKAPGGRSERRCESVCPGFHLCCLSAAHLMKVLLRPGTLAQAPPRGTKRVRRDPESVTQRSSQHVPVYRGGGFRNIPFVVLLCRCSTDDVMSPIDLCGWCTHPNE